MCGSDEHPDKAVLGADHVSADQVERAEAERARAASASCSPPPSGAACWASGPRRCGPGSARLSAGRGRTRTTTARAAVAESRAAEADVARLVPALDGFDAQTREREAERATAVARLAGERATLEVTLLDLDAAEAEVVAGRADHPTVAARHSELLGRVATSVDRAGRAREQDAAQDESRRREDELADGAGRARVRLGRRGRAAAVDAAVLAELDRS